MLLNENENHVIHVLVFMKGFTVDVSNIVRLTCIADCLLSQSPRTIGDLTPIEHLNSN